MKKIWKFTLDLQDDQEVEMPSGAELLTVQMQADTICLWAIVDPHTTKRDRRTFYIVGTGHDMPPKVSAANYVGTVQQAGGALIWHVFEGE
jgi:hypothetical protein